MYKTLFLVLAAVIIAVLVPNLIAPINISAAKSLLARNGYVVLSAGEYELVAKEATAVAAAQAAVIAADKLILFNENETFLYPDQSDKTVTLTAHANPNTWSNWAEITDSGATTLTSKFAAQSGYIREVMFRDYSVVNNIYLVELSYGAAKTVLGRVKVRSDWTYVLPLTSAPIAPAGETVYYRMMCETGGATLLADFRYYFAAE